MNNILVIQTASIGDVILATSLLEKLHRFYPEAKIDFLVRKGMEELFSGHPFLRDLLLWDKKKKYRDFIRIIREVRKKRYDLVVNVQRFALTGILTVLSGAPQTIGFDKNPLSRFFTQRTRHRIEPGVHEIVRNQALIAGLTDGVPEMPKLYPEPSLATRYSLPEKIKTDFESGSKTAIRDTRAGPRVTDLYYTLSPASLWFTKQFPADRWVDLIRCFPPDTTVYLLGSKTDYNLCEQIRQEANGKRQEMNSSGYQGIRSSGYPVILNLAGKFSFLESASLMQGAKMNFTNDSAPMHLASAVNAAVTVVFCSTVPDFGFGPLSDDSKIVEVNQKLPCRPCGLHGKKACPEGHFDCAWKVEIGKLNERI